MCAYPAKKKVRIWVAAIFFLHPPRRAYYSHHAAQVRPEPDCRGCVGGHGRGVGAEGERRGGVRAWWGSCPQGRMDWMRRGASSIRGWRWGHALSILVGMAFFFFSVPSEPACHWW
jgi:hypothetical protein